MGILLKIEGSGRGFTSAENVDMLSCYILCHRNCVQAKRTYFTKYPEQRQHEQTIFRRLWCNQMEHGEFKIPSLSRHKHNSEKTNVLRSTVYH